MKNGDFSLAQAFTPGFRETTELEAPFRGLRLRALISPLKGAAKKSFAPLSPGVNAWAKEKGEAFVPA